MPQDQVRENLGQACFDTTVRRGLHRLEHVWKRPRYVLAPDPQREKKPPHSAGASKDLADRLGMRLLWLPKRASELNPMESLWGARPGRDLRE